MPSLPPMGRALFWRGVVPALQRLPPAAVLSLARRASARAPVRADPAVEEAVARAFPQLSPEGTRDLAREAARCRLREKLEMAAFPRLDERTAGAHVRIEGREHLEASLAAGRGVVLAGAHLGVHGLPPLALRLAGCPVSVRTFLRADRDLRPAEAWSQGHRLAIEARLPVPFIRAGSPGDDPLAPLARGEALITTGDGLGPSEVLGETPRVLPLLGVPTRWPLQAFTLAAGRGCPVLGLFLRAEGDGHRLRLTAPLSGPDPLAAYVTLYEEELRAAPAEWQLWDRFRPGLLVA